VFGCLKVCEVPCSSLKRRG